MAYECLRKVGISIMLFSDVLPNGMRIVIASHPDTAIVSCGIFVRQGSRNEEGYKSGMSHFLEHMIFNTQRAVRRNKTNVSKLLNSGGFVNASTTKECTSFEGTTLVENTEVLLRALYELVFEAKFSAEDIQIERGVILAEIKRKQGSTGKLYDYLTQCLYGQAGYGNLVLGIEETISQFTIEQLMDCYNQIYVADNIVVAVVTNQEPNELMQLANEIFRKVKSGEPTPTNIPVSEEVHLKVLRQKSEQVHLVMGGIAPSIRDESSPSFDVSIHAWGVVPNSRLFLEVRERRGLVYQIQSFYNGYFQTGHWGIYTIVPRNKFDEVMRVLVNEVDRIGKEPFSTNETSRTISAFKTNLYSKFQHSDYYQKSIGRREIFGESFYPNNMIRRYERAEPNQMFENTSKYINPHRLSIAAIGEIERDDILNNFKNSM